MAINEQVQELNVSSASYANKTTVVGQEDIPALSAQAMQESVEYMPRNFIIPVLNKVIRLLNGTYSKAETDKAINDKVTAIGAGDMTKAVYDPDNAGLSFTDLQTAKSELAAAQAAIAAMENKEFVRVTLKAANWARAGNYLWYQNVSVSGMSEYWIPGPPEFYLGIYGAGSNIKWDEVKLQLEELPKINAVEAHDGYMTFICLEDYPTWDIYLYVPRIGGRAN